MSFWKILGLYQSLRRTPGSKIMTMSNSTKHKLLIALGIFLMFVFAIGMAIAWIMIVYSLVMLKTT